MNVRQFDKGFDTGWEAARSGYRFPLRCILFGSPEVAIAFDAAEHLGPRVPTEDAMLGFCDGVESWVDTYIDDEGFDDGMHS